MMFLRWANDLCVCVYVDIIFSLIINAIPLNYFVLMLKFRFIILLQNFDWAFFSLFGIMGEWGKKRTNEVWKTQTIFRKGWYIKWNERKRIWSYSIYEQTEEWEKKNHHRLKFWECFFGVHRITYLSFTMLFLFNFENSFFWQLKQINSRFFSVFSRFFLWGCFSVNVNELFMNLSVRNVYSKNIYA